MTLDIIRSEFVNRCFVFLTISHRFRDYYFQASYNEQCHALNYCGISWTRKLTIPHLCTCRSLFCLFCVSMSTDHIVFVVIVISEPMSRFLLLWRIILLSIVFPVKDVNQLLLDHLLRILLVWVLYDWTKLGFDNACVLAVRWWQPPLS